MKRCLTCAQLGNWDRSGRCGSCQRHVLRARYRDPLRVERKRLKYNADFRAARREWVRIVNSGVVICPRCGGLIEGHDWDLGHQADGSLHAEHARCNRSAGGGRGA